MRTIIKKWGINAEGIGYIDRKPVFIPGAIPNETVEFEITEKKETYSIGKLIEVIEPASARHHAPCTSANECQGCALMHVKYKAQCKMKEESLRQALKKYCGYTKPILPIIKNSDPLGYRNACKVPLQRVDGKWMAGMYKNKGQNFIGIPRCLVHEKAVEQTRQDVVSLLNEEENKGLETLVIKSFGPAIQVILVGEEASLSDTTLDKVYELSHVTSVYVNTGKKNNSVFAQKMDLVRGDEKIEIELGDLKLKLLPRSFFQLNTKQAKALYEYVVEWIKPCDTLVEAYSGIGAMSLMVKDKAKQIYGYETIQDAVDNANENALVNDAKNVIFECIDAAKGLAKNKKVDALIVDPPRTGLDDAMKETIMRSRIQQLVYVSCNPSTLAKDLKTLMKAYTIDSIQPFDFFSQTQHVETVVFLSRKKSQKRYYKR